MTTSILTRRYTSSDREDWNNFVERAKNSTFLFKREYVDYHEQRFHDHSLLIYADGKLSALLIANEVGDKLESHGGLTYGGLILENKVKLMEVLRFFYHIVKYCQANGFKTILYKCLPPYFATLPANEDLYALFILKAELVRRDTSMVLDNPGAVKTNGNRSFKIASSKDPETFWNQILIPNLQERHAVDPVHSASEIRMLMERFPENIQLFEVHDTQLVAGAVVYVMPVVAHLQYISANDAGRRADASTSLMRHLLKNVFAGKKFFSFGTSNTDGGRKLNTGLTAWKEAFGARTFIHDLYEIQTDNYKLLKDYE